MNIEKQSVDNLNATIVINITQEDYKEKFKSELKKAAGKANLKGFRKGKTPASVIRKMYGKSVLAEVVNETLQKALTNYLDEEKLNILGQPIPSDDQDGDLEFNVNQLEDYTFKFDVGIAPEFEIDGVSEDDEYDIYKIEVDEKVITEELENAQKRLGTHEHPEGAVIANDIIKVQAEELDGDEVKEDGWATEFSVLVDSLTDEYKEEVLSLSTGDTFNFDIYQLEKEKGEDYVKKYLLNVPKVEEGEEEPVIGNMFQGKISEISRLKIAELDQEFFDKYFGKDEVKSEEEARAKIEEYIGTHYHNQALQFMYRNIMDKLVADTEVEMPKAFLKKWLKMTNEKLTDSEIEKDFDGFLENMKWTLIKNKLVNDFGVEVSQDEIIESMRNKVKGYFGQYGMEESYVDKVLQQMLQNQEEINKTYEELQAGKLFTKIGEKVKHKENKISLEDFNEKVKELNEKQQPQ